MRGYNGIPLLRNAAGTPLTVAIGAVGANTTAEVTVAVTGARVGDGVMVIPRAACEAGYGPISARVSAANVVSVQFMNTTAGGLPAAAQLFDVVIYPQN